MLWSFIRRGLWGAALLSVAACGGGEPGQPTSTAVQGVQSAPKSSPAAKPVARASVAEISPAAITELGAAGDSLGWDLYGALPPARGNLLLGIHSARAVLAAVSPAAGGRTGEEFAYVAGLGGDPKQLAARWGALEAALADPGRGGAVATSLAAWAQGNYPFRADFLAGLASAGAPVATANFREALYDAGAGITGWVQEHAGPWATSWMPHPNASSYAQLVLADSLRIRASWTQPFSPVPREGAFELADGVRVSVPILEQRAALRYWEGENYRAFELPTDREGLSFLVVVPDAGAFEKVESALDADAVSELDELLARQYVHVVLPKVTLMGSTSLAGPLVRLGLGTALDPNRADFSGLGGGIPHFLSAVDHQAAFSLTEKGFEVSAASLAEWDGSKESLGPARSDPGFQVVALGPKTATQPVVAPVEAVVARPFLFVVRDLRTRTTLFLGRVTDPYA